MKEKTILPLLIRMTDLHVSHIRGLKLPEVTEITPAGFRKECTVNSQVPFWMLLGKLDNISRPSKPWTYLSKAMGKVCTEEEISLGLGLAASIKNSHPHHSTWCQKPTQNRPQPNTSRQHTLLMHLGSN